MAVPSNPRPKNETTERGAAASRPPQQQRERERGSKKKGGSSTMTWRTKEHEATPSSRCPKLVHEIVKLNEAAKFTYHHKLNEHLP